MNFYVFFLEKNDQNPNLHQVVTLDLAQNLDLEILAKENLIKKKAKKLEKIHDPLLPIQKSIPIPNQAVLGKDQMKKRKTEITKNPKSIKIIIKFF